MSFHDRTSLLAELDKLGITTRTVEHPAVFTVAESEAIHKHDMLPGGHVKNLFLKDKKGQLFLVTALHDAQIDLKQIHTRIGASGRVSFAKAETLREVLGIEPGSVTPLAVINDGDARVKIVLDARMMRHDAINCHPLENTATTHIASQDLIRFIEHCGHTAEIIAVDELAQDI